MSRKYTVREMRELAEMIDHGGAFALTDPATIGANVAMLRQAADMMERDERCEKKWEYALVANGVTYNNHYCDFRSATLIRGFGEKVVRREVGEWEEVPNEAS